MDPQAPRTQATLRAMQWARTKGQAHIVFDVVPHRFYQVYRSSQFGELLDGVDILISGVPTIRRLLNMGAPGEKITRAIVEATTERLTQLCDRFCLRFGDSGCDEQVIWDSQRQKLVWEETGHKKAQDKRGYGDRLTLKTLSDVFEITPIGHNKLT